MHEHVNIHMYTHVVESAVYDECNSLYRNTKNETTLHLTINYIHKTIP